MKYEGYTKKTGALYSKKFKEVPTDNITRVDKEKEEALLAITVVTVKGTWKADEKSQARMVNAIAFLSRKPVDTTKKWKMLDKTKVDVTKDDIEEAFDLAVAELDSIIVGE